MRRREATAIITVDGIWGPKTETALASFQKEHGLRVTDHYDQQTAQILPLPQWKAG